MRILAIVDYLPLGAEDERVLLARCEGAKGVFDLPVTQDQAAMLVHHSQPERPPQREALDPAPQAQLDPPDTLPPLTEADEDLQPLRLAHSITPEQT